MPSNRLLSTLVIALAACGLAGCDDLLGSKVDPTTEEIFDEGRTDPGLVSQVGYVPLVPFFSRGAAGPLQAPQDVYVGYDQFLYVVDDLGLHVLDLAGRPADLAYRGEGGGVTPYVPIQGATAVVQDRRLHVYVAGRRDTTLLGQTWTLPVIYRFSGLGTGAARLEDVIWHPFDDDSRKFNRRDPIPTDEEVEFTGIAPLHDHRIYVSRRGPVNDQGGPILPHNAIMGFTPDGVNTVTVPLSPTRPSLRSAVGPSDVLTYFGPPQRSGLPANDNFVLAQAPESGQPVQYGVLSIRSVVTSDGIVYRPDTEKLAAAQSGDPERGAGFLYEEFKFDRPSDLAYAADGRNSLFVLDAGSDSLFVFTSAGIEGVTPPAGSRSRTPIVVSFGGTGDGPLQFRNPQGVAYYNRLVYVADTGNNRISRFRLNTDFE